MKKILSCICIILSITCCSPLDQRFEQILELAIPEPPKPPDPPLPITVTVKIDQNIGGNTSFSPGKTCYEIGEYIKLTASPSEGWTFNSWTGTINSTENPLVISTSKNEWIIPIFSKTPDPEIPPLPVTVTVKIDQNIGGNTTASPEKTCYEIGEHIKITASPSEGWIFNSWTGTINSTENPFVINTSKNEWIIPIFSKTPDPEILPLPVTVTVKIDQNIGGNTTASPEKTCYEIGEYIKLTASPSEGWTFNSWTGTINSTENPLVISTTKNEWIIPVFSKMPEIILEPILMPITWTVKIENEIGGIINYNPAKSSYESGEYLHVVAVPHDGWKFDGWTGTSSGLSEELFLTINSEFWLIPHFSILPVPEQYSLTIETSGLGTIIKNPDKQSYAEGEIVSITSVPTKGYRLTQWDGDLSGTDENQTITMNSNKSVHIQFDKRIWTFIIYMAADNDLEAAAIQDFNEIEAALTTNLQGDILVLFDRSPGYDSTNGNWSDTRLYKIQNDPFGADTVIRSPRISCPILGISDTGNVELDMANDKTLSYILDYARESHPALNYGLIFWGHGTGWRASGSYEEGNIIEPFKAISIDDTSNSFMSLSSAGKAINGKDVSIIGMDTCYGALLEVATEFTNRATWLIGSVNATPASGWNYTDLFSSFANGIQNSEAFVISSIDQFRTQYALTPNVSISAIKLDKTEALRKNFESFAHNSALTITNSFTQNLVRNCVMNDCISYHLSTYPCDSFINISNFVDTISNNRAVFTNSITIQNQILNSKINFFASLLVAVPYGWSSSDSNARDIGIHLIPLLANGVSRPSHETAYIRGSGDSNQSRFVLNSTSWVPTKPTGSSFLDKIFYVQF